MADTSLPGMAWMDDPDFLVFFQTGSSFPEAVACSRGNGMQHSGQWVQEVDIGEAIKRSGAD